jgi:hypothetical protein
VASSAFSAIAQYRQQNQQARIAQGIQNGAISAAEQQRLAASGQAIDGKIAAANAGGKMDVAEFARVMQAQSDQSQRIARMENDAKPLGVEAQAAALQNFSVFQENIDARVQNGVEQGKISEDEKKSIQQTQAAAQGVLDKAMSDNVLTRGEFRDVMNALHSVNRQVASTRYGQKAWPAQAPAVQEAPADYTPVSVKV